MLGGRKNIGNIRVACFAQWSWNTDAHGIDVSQCRVITGKMKAFRFNERLNSATGNIRDIALAPVTAIDFLLIYVYARDMEASLCKSDREWQTNIAKTDDSNA